MSTIFNANDHSDHTKNLAFFDPGGNVSLQRYDIMKYPQFDKLVSKTLGFFWQPEEIDISKDHNDYKNLSDHEKHIFKNVLSRQILLDSVQGRSPTLAFGPIVGIPELETWIQTWAFNETIHSRSYTHIIKNLYPDPQEIFDNVLNISEIVDCAKDISFHYDNLIELSSWYRLLGEGKHVINGNPLNITMYDLKKALWLTVMSVNILEGIRFYGSFSSSFAFAENKVLEGNAKIIKLICLKDDHEILTDTGWKLFKDLNKTEKVAQYNSDGSIEFVNPINYIEEDFSGNLINFKNRQGQFDISYTPDHRVIYREDGKIKESTAGNFNPSCVKEYIVTGKKLSGKSGLTAMDRFRIAVQADGSISDRYDGSICGTIPVNFHLKKQRKIIRLKEILTDLKSEGVTYVENVSDIDFSDFRVSVPLRHNINKKFTWIDLNEINFEWARNFLSELVQWDGHLPNKDSSRYYYSTSDSSCADTVQAIVAISGYRCKRGIQKDNRKSTYQDIHRLHILTGSDSYCCGPKYINKSEEFYEGKVYCVTVPSGMIVVRANMQTMITGNCRDENIHLAGTQLLLKILPKDDPIYAQIAIDTRAECVQLFKDAVTQEKEWVKYMFKHGSMIGLNESLLCDYIEWIANKRMIAVGLPSPYKVGSCPLPFMSRWIAGADVQVAPQETEISSYVIGGTTQDVTENTFKGFSL